MIVRVLGALAVLAAPATQAAAERDAARVFFMGHSTLWEVQAHRFEASVPYWLDRLAEAGGRDFAMAGRWGPPRRQAEALPPRPAWRMPGVTSAWDGQDSLGAAAFDALVIAPQTDVQERQPDIPFADAGLAGPSPYSALLAVLDHVHAASPATRLFVYDSWPAPVVAAPETGGASEPRAAGAPDAAQTGAAGTAVDTATRETDADAAQAPGTDAATDTETRETDAAAQAGRTGTAADASAAASALRPREAWRLQAAGEHARWFADLDALIDRSRPGLPVARIRLAETLADLLGEGGPLQDLPMEALFDEEGRGTPTLYLLAAMIAHAALYEAPPPPAFQPPDSVHAGLRDAYPAVARRLGATLPAPAETAAPDASLPVRASLALPPPQSRPAGAPALGMGLARVSDWSTQQPFLDVMKSARVWVGHVDGTWGAMSADYLRAMGYLSVEGWPLAIPPEAEALEAMILTDQSPDARHLHGDYILLHDGQGRLRLTGRAARVRSEPGRIDFAYTPGPGSVGIRLLETDPDDPVRNIRVVRRDRLEMLEAGAIFNPDWLARIEDMRVLRFMDWMATNGSPIARWEDRPRMEDATWAAWGVPPEAMIRLANRVGADPWFTLPHLADDDYVRRFAELVRDELDPGLRAHVEFSNEVWNRIFPQEAWARAQAEALWGPSQDGRMQFYALRAAQVMQIWTEVFGAAADDRLVRVVATQTGWPGLEQAILYAPLALLQLGRSPAEFFDAYAVTGYFGYDLGGEDMAPRIDDWLDRSEAAARAEGEAQGLMRVALREYVRQARFDRAVASVTEALEDGSVARLTGELFPYHAQVAEEAGLRLVMYEGGTHLVGRGPRLRDDRLTDFFTAYNYTPEVAKLYETVLGAWVAAGGTLFTAYVDVAAPSRWGSWGALRHLDDANPRWDMLMAYNATGPNDWAGRDRAVFEGGATRIGGTGADRIEGTPRPDLLLGGAGDDRLLALGGDDLLHGGPGSDVAVLPGARADWSMLREGSALVAESPAGRVRMTAVERLVFDADPDTEIDVADF